MTERPSDRAIAQAFYEIGAGNSEQAINWQRIERRARELDDEAPEGAQVAVAYRWWNGTGWSYGERTPPGAKAHALYTTAPQPQDAARDREDAELFRYIERHVAAWHAEGAVLPRIVVDPMFHDSRGDVCKLIVTGHDGVGTVSLRTALRIIQEASST